MKLEDFHIGLEFFCPAMPPNSLWRCTDVGNRVVVAICLNDHKDDPTWYRGPPYAVMEHVFDENSIVDCHDALAITKETTGRSLGPKTAYIAKYPRHFVIFNASIFAKSGERVWFGDIDIDEDANRLKKFATELGEDILLFRESDVKDNKPKNWGDAIAVFPVTGDWLVSAVL